MLTMTAGIARGTVAGLCGVASQGLPVGCTGTGGDSFALFLDLLMTKPAGWRLPDTVETDHTLKGENKPDIQFSLYLWITLWTSD
ncbi:hypothetical protein [Methylomagnum ishizawai]|uniref:hypothetical protein n=1 Tax=Methylomagnum ishizawai TaxID=1760988 RepID=UPI0020CB2D33|nr:hypothetical protein [Methylomagnum ishizawai]